MDDIHRLLCHLQGNILALQVVTASLVQDLGKTHGDDHARNVIADAFSVHVWPDSLNRNSLEFIEMLNAFEKAHSVFSKQLNSTNEG